mgnify:CR=1 FL=1
MANVYIGSDYTITDVNMCNTAGDAQLWYQVNFQQTGKTYPIMYITPYNDEKFPKNLAKSHFIANVLPSVNTYISIINNGTYNALDDWDTEA